MGTQGSARHAMFGGQGGVRALRRRITSLAASLAVLPLVAGCSGSSFPSFGSSNSQSTVPPPPPSASVAATGQPAYASPPGQPAVQPGAYAAAPPAQAAASSEGGTVGSFSTSYVNFIKAFRDPDPDSPEARPPARAQQSGAAPQQNAYAPRPPSTYVPSGQPYNPPPAEPAYAPAVAQQTYAAPPPAQQIPPRSAQQAAAPVSKKQTKAARASSQQNAAAAPAQPAVAAPPAAPPPAAQQDYSDSLPYPKQSLADVFRGSTETQTQTVPRPPSTYTPSGQPYTPQGQAAAGAPATGTAAAAPASQTPSDSLPYPKQSLFEVFSNNK